MESKSRRRVYLSLIIPVYNETTRLVSGLYKILSYLTKQTYPWEVIIVDDGSAIPVVKHLARPGERSILHFDLTKLPVTIHRLPHNSGKGKAIAEGIARARGEVIVFCDIDLSVPISELKTMLQHLKRDRMVIASRRLPDSKIAVHQSYARETAGRIFTALSNIICTTGVADVTCGFKGFDALTARKLFGAGKISRWVFDTEIVFLARKHGIPVREMPVVWTNKSGSKVRILDNIGSLIDLMRIRWYDARGKYEI